MKTKYTFYLTYPYKNPEFNRSEDLIENFAFEEIERIWGIEFVYENGKTQKYYDDLKWFTLPDNDPVYLEFKEIDGSVSLTLPPLKNGVPLKLNKTYCFNCTVDDSILASRFEDKITRAWITK